MNEILNAYKAPFVTLAPEDVPAPSTIAVVWGLTALFAAKVL